MQAPGGAPGWADSALPGTRRRQVIAAWGPVNMPRGMRRLTKNAILACISGMERAGE